MASSPQPEPTYTVFIRLPFARGDFIDPPPVNWDASKDEALWNIVSEVAKTEIDWNDIASRFQVTVDFLLQQVAFLTERHASQVRAQMRRAAAAARGSAAPSPIPPAEGASTSEALRAAVSGVGGATQGRAPSQLSIRKDSPLPRQEAASPGTPMRGSSRPQATRTSSANTSIFTTRNLGGSSKAGLRPAADNQRRRLSSLPITTNAEDRNPESLSPGPATSESSSEESSPAQSRIIRRPPRFQSNDVASSYADDDEDEPAFMPFKPQTEGSGGPHDLSATLRGSSRRVPKGTGKERAHRSQTSDSSASSPAFGPETTSTEKSRAANPLSPKRAMELVGRSPSGKGKGYSRDSDGTPSMGSSFSDLDDASVTQSALEEALASKMQDGGTLGSRMSTISHAFRSRYLPKPNNP